VSNKEQLNKAFEVRYRTGYLATKSAMPAPAPSLVELLESPLDATAIGLAGQAKPDSRRPGSYRVRITVDLRDVHLNRNDDHFTGAFDLSFLYPASQSIKIKTVRVDIPEDQLAQAMQEGYEVNVAGLEGQTGEIHVAVRDRATGAGGSLHIPLAPQ
jgi:hypothetical protein